MTVPQINPDCAVPKRKQLEIKKHDMLNLTLHFAYLTGYVCLSYDVTLIVMPYLHSLYFIISFRRNPHFRSVVTAKAPSSDDPPRAASCHHVGGIWHPAHADSQHPALPVWSLRQFASTQFREAGGHPAERWPPGDNAGPRQLRRPTQRGQPVQSEAHSLQVTREHQRHLRIQVTANIPRHPLVADSGDILQVDVCVLRQSPE